MCNKMKILVVGDNITNFNTMYVPGTRAKVYHDHVDRIARSVTHIEFGGAGLLRNLIFKTVDAGKSIDAANFNNEFHVPGGLEPDLDEKDYSAWRSHFVLHRYPHDEVEDFDLVKRLKNIRKSTEEKLEPGGLEPDFDEKDYSGWRSHFVLHRYPHDEVEDFDLVKWLKNIRISTEEKLEPATPGDTTSENPISKLSALIHASKRRKGTYRIKKMRGKEMWDQRYQRYQPNSNDNNEAINTIATRFKQRYIDRYFAKNDDTSPAGERGTCYLILVDHQLPIWECNHPDCGCNTPENVLNDGCKNIAERLTEEARPILEAIESCTHILLRLSCVKEKVKPNTLIGLLKVEMEKKYAPIEELKKKVAQLEKKEDPAANIQEEIVTLVKGIKTDPTGDTLAALAKLVKTDSTGDTLAALAKLAETDVTTGTLAALVALVKEDTTGDTLAILVKLVKTDTTGYTLAALVRMEHPATELVDIAKLMIDEERLRDKTTLVISSSTLRSSDVFVSNQLSWERVVDDITWGLRHHKNASFFSRFKDIVVSFETAGALHLSFNLTKNEYEGSLVFDHKNLERFWLSQHEGHLPGQLYFLCIAIMLKTITQDNPTKALNPVEWDEALKMGVHVHRDMHRVGYTLKNDQNDDVVREREYQWPQDEAAHLFVDELSRSDRDFLATYHVEHFDRERKQVRSILFENLLENSDPIHLFPKALELAEEIVKNGIAKLDKFPIAKFGELTVIGREDIEEFRSIRRLVRDYQKAKLSKTPQPLSIAIFGGPGSGKSFSIKEIIKDAIGCGESDFHTFNLSQFSDVESLPDTFNFIRDETLANRLPIIFWDEFDSRVGKAEFGWLKYFLAPMQDGTFLQAGRNHPIGKCIFVFAGGTSKTMNEFQKKEEHERLAKIGDFRSRLKGYLDIPSIDPPENDCQPDHMKLWWDINKVERGKRCEDGPEFLERRKGHALQTSQKKRFGDGKEPDRRRHSDQESRTSFYDIRHQKDWALCILRRSLILRSIVMKNEYQDLRAPQSDGRRTIINIDDSLLTALLTTSNYLHDSRSLESTLKMSVFDGQRRYTRSLLPSRKQRLLHNRVDNDVCRCILYQDITEEISDSIIAKFESSLSDATKETVRILINTFRHYLMESGYDIESTKYVPTDDIGILEGTDKIKPMIKTILEKLKSNGPDEIQTLLKNIGIDIDTFSDVMAKTLETESSGLVVCETPRSENVRNVAKQFTVNTANQGEPQAP
jgi:hypothetical protein